MESGDRSRRATWAVMCQSPPEMAERIFQRDVSWGGAGSLPATCGAVDVATSLCCTRAAAGADRSELVGAAAEAGPGAGAGRGAARVLRAGAGAGAGCVLRAGAATGCPISLS